MHYFSTNYIKIFILILCGVVSITSYSQNITGNKETFVKEAFSIIKNQEGLKDKEAEPIVEKLNTFWAAELDENTRNSIVETARLLAERKINNHNLLGYLQGIQSLQLKNTANLAILQQYISTLIKDKKYQKVELLVGFVKGFGNAYILKDNRNYQWIAENPTYSFKADTSFRIYFEELSLKYVSDRDSGTIKNTKGTFHVERNIWKGKDGTVNWTRAAIDEKDAYATLKRYTINTKNANWEADSVTLSYPKILNKKILGKYKDKLSESFIKDPKEVQYPRFSSYEAPLLLKDVFENIDYLGGANLYGSGLVHEQSQGINAEVLIKQNNVVKMRATGKNLMFKDKKIIGKDMTISIYLEKDSIVNMGLDFKYIDAEKQVSIFRPADASASQSPFTDTYHQLDIYNEAVYWNVKDSVVRFTSIMNSQTSKARFESYDMFRLDRLAALKENMYGKSALNILGDCSGGAGSTITGAEFIRCSKYEAIQAKQMIYRLADQGYILYDAGKDKIYVKDKAEKYLQAKMRRVDYDVLEFNSQTGAKENNAELNLYTKDLIIKGIEMVYLSDSQQVYIYPIDEKIIVKKNRNFVFDGMVQAGKFDFFGKTIDFDYDKFTINLNKIDSVHVKIEGKKRDRYGKYELIDIKTRIQIVKGKLEIDNPDNKSGLKAKKYPQYPIFNNIDPAFAYYEYYNAQGNVYKEDTFKFAIDPFIIDSLDNFNPNGIKLAGTMMPASIFPAFKSVLKIRPDYSFGIQETVPVASPFSMYNGKATYTGELDLSNQGFKALKGTINYLTTVLTSKELILYPDSVKGMASTVKTTASAADKQPDMKAEDVKVRWDIKNDKLELFPTKGVQFYSDKCKFIKGTLAINKQGVMGKNGTLAFESGDIISKNILFNDKVASSDSALFVLFDPEKSTSTNKLELFTAAGMKMKMDFEKDVVDMQIQGIDSCMYFHSNQYAMCYAKLVKWYFAKKQLEVLSDPRAKFISFNPEQDSLSFEAGYALYNVKDKIIHCEKVTNLQISDAYITPNKGKMDILPPDGKIGDLDSATVQIKQSRHKYEIVQAKVEILDKKHCRSQGYYLYKDGLGNSQKVRVETSYTDSLLNTYTFVQIQEGDTLKLNPYMQYTGSIEISPYRPNFYFKGGIKTIVPCKNMLAGSYVNYTGEADVNNIQFPFELGNTDTNSFFLGVAMVQESVFDVKMGLLADKPVGENSKVMITPAIGTWGFNTATKELSYTKDMPSLPVDSLAKFDKKHKRKKEKKRKSNADEPDIQVSYQPTTCTGYAAGEINMTENTPELELITAGSINYKKDTARFRLFMACQFDFWSKGISKITDIMETMGVGGKMVETNSDHYKNSLQQLVSARRYKKFYKQVSTNSKAKLPKEIRSTIGFSDMTMVWNKEKQAFISEGQIGVHNIGKKVFNRFINGKIVIQKRSGGDFMGIYLEMSKDVWYYFEYLDGMLTAYSYSDEFNQDLDNATRKSRRKANGYIYAVGDGMQKTTMLTDFDISPKVKEIPKENKEILPTEETPKPEITPEIPKQEEK